MDAEVSQAVRQRLLLRHALKDALEGLEDMIGYVPEPFAEKWEHQGYIKRAQEALREDEENA